MNNVTFQNILLSTIIKNMEDYSCLYELFQLNKRICCIVMEHLNITRTSLLKKQGHSSTRKNVVYLKHNHNVGAVSRKTFRKTIPIPLLLESNIFFDIHWAGLLLYVSRVRHYPTREARRGHCVCKIVDKLRERRIGGKHAFFLIKKILTLGRISNSDKSISLHLSLSTREECTYNKYERDIAFLLLRSGELKDDGEMILPLIQAIKKKDVELVRAFLYEVTSWMQNSLLQAFNEADDENISLLLLAYMETMDSGESKKEDSKCVVS